VAETIFKHVWCSGLEATDEVRIAELQKQLTQLMQLSQSRFSNRYSIAGS
jgi:hypothetical protein